jgi:transcription termination/antitermination protein NusG
MTDETKYPEDQSPDENGSDVGEGAESVGDASVVEPESPPEGISSEASSSTESSASAADGDAASTSATGEMATGEIEHPAGGGETGQPEVEPEKPSKSPKKKARAEGEANGASPASKTSGAAAGDGSEEGDQPQFDWYILKVASNREESVRDALMRRVKIEGLEEYFDEVIVPTETVSEYKGGKRRTKKQKLWPGYLVAHMVINDETWFVVRETPGIGDFTGAAGKPTPMQAQEVERVLSLIRPPAEKPDKARPVIAFAVGDRVKINEGTFQNFEGQVEGVDEANGHVTVMINIFGRSTPVELAYWQVEAV